MSNSWIQQKDGYLSGTLVDNTTGVGIEFASVALYRHRDSSLVTGTISSSQGLHPPHRQQ